MPFDIWEALGTFGTEPALVTGTEAMPALSMPAALSYARLCERLVAQRPSHAVREAVTRPSGVCGLHSEFTTCTRGCTDASLKCIVFEPGGNLRNTYDSCNLIASFIFKHDRSFTAFRGMCTIVPGNLFP